MFCGRKAAIRIMSKQTSIQWYAQKDTEITIKYLEGKINQIQCAIEKTKCLEQAKQMHKEEIQDAYWEGGQDVPLNAKQCEQQCEQYYQETYGGKGGLIS